MGIKKKTLNYSPKSDEMVLTVHRWFANKSCPGDWLYARLGDVAAKVTAELSGASTSTGTVTATGLYRVRKIWADAKSEGSIQIAGKCEEVCCIKSGDILYLNANGNVVSGSNTSTIKNGR